MYRYFVLVLCLFSLDVFAHVSEPKTESGIADKLVEKIVEPIVIRVTGYGAYANKSEATSESKRLLAIRASKLDAYRALAERVYGINISGASTVKDFAMQSDSFGAVVDSYVRGARVVSIMENKQTGFETVLELLLPGEFQDCLNKVNSFKYGMECLRPFSPSDLGDSMTEQSSGSTASRKMQSVYFLQ